MSVLPDQPSSVIGNKWEKISAKDGDHETHRMPTPEGWIVRHLEIHPDAGVVSVSLCYVPNDYAHKWVVS